MNESAFVDAIRPWLPDGDGPLRAYLTLAIRQAAATGQLAPGSRLPPERALAEALHVSRPTVSAVMSDLRELGVVSSRQGSGTWITEPAPNHGEVGGDPQVPFVERLLAQGSIDLAAATAPDASLLPPLRLETADLLGVEPANGFSLLGLHELRDRIAQRLRPWVPARAENVIVTSGAHQALALVVAAIAPTGSVVLVEDTTYGGLVDMLESNGCVAIGIPRDHDGPVPDRLADLIRRHSPSLVILVSSVHSPSGRVSSDDRCDELAEVLLAAETTVVLDETYADLEFVPSGRPLSGRLGTSAIRVGSLSKSLWTGLRIGWVVGPSDLCRSIGRRRWRQFDLGPSVPSQLIGSQAIEQVESVLEVRRRRLRERSTWLIERISADLPRWTPTPVDGGLALWVVTESDGEEVAAAAMTRGVAIIPGSSCRADGQPTNAVRICFDRPPDVLSEALDRLVGM